MAAACGPGPRQADDDDDVADGGIKDGPEADSPFVEADVMVPPMTDAGIVYIDAGGGGNQDGGCIGSSCTNPVDDGCLPGTADVCDNGADDNCNGQVDENCACQAGAVQSCFLGQPGYRGVGACTDGQQTCQGSGEFTMWGPCTGGIGVGAEACDSVDNDCNGCVDDDPLCCEVDLTCPTSMPEGQPFQNYVIDSGMFYAGAVTSVAWTVDGGPCDDLLSPNVSFTLNGVTSTVATGPVLSFRPTLSGDYTVHVTMTLPDGTIYECTFIVHIRGPGLRVELCWDTTGSADIDLHLHRPDTTTPWFTTNGNPNGNINPDDCNYQNCKAAAHVCLLPPIICPTDVADWGYMDSPLAECVGGPEGAQWMQAGFCANPRLDIDNIFTVGKPENINVDRPENGKSYRVGVHHYSGTVVTHPMVNVYCGGTLMATYGQAPDQVPGFGSGGPMHAQGPFWRVVDVLTQVNAAGVTTGCDLTPLHPAGMATGYNVTCPKPGSTPTCSDLSY